MTRPTHRTLFAALFQLLLLCGSAAAHAQDSPGYSLEEWGLVRIFEGGAEVATSGVQTGRERLDSLDPGRPEPSARKPVIYLLPDNGWDEESVIRIEVGLSEHRVVETWPAPNADSEEGIAWDVELGADTCSASHIQAPVIEHCDELDAHVCEAGEISEWLTTSPHCIRVGEQLTPVILYNGNLPGSAAEPVTFAEGGVRIGAYDLSHLYWGDEAGIYYAEDLDAGSFIETPTEPVFGQPDGGYELFEHMDGILASEGLTTRDDFFAAWEGDVLAPPFPWRAFGIYTPEAVEELIPLSASPPPSQTTRVLAFSYEIDSPFLEAYFLEHVEPSPPTPLNAHDDEVPLLAQIIDGRGSSEPATTSLESDDHNQERLEQIVNLIRSSGMSDCADAYFQTSSDEMVRFRFAAVITPQGEVSSVETVETSSDSRTLLNCAESAILELVFPASDEDEAAEIDFPIVIRE